MGVKDGKEVDDQMRQCGAFNRGWGRRELRGGKGGGVGGLRMVRGG